MADRRKPKQKRRQLEPEKPTKEEYAVGKFMRFNVPIKEGKLMGMTVQYFKANKAVDALLESKFAKQKEPLFGNRAQCVDYCNRLLEKGLYHRAGKVERSRDKTAVASRKKVGDAQDSPAAGDRKRKKGKKDEKKDDEKEETEKDEGKEEDDEKEKKEEEKKDDEKKKKKRLKLEMHDNQVFKDGDEIYVWIYDPVPVKTFLIGLLLVLGAVGVCLFPLWPPEVRLGVYYLSLAAGGFVVLILGLCVVRMILFCLVWAVTFGKHHFWLLPNLTEDVGFFDSFKPLYKHERNDGSADTKKSKDKEKSSKKESENVEKDKKQQEVGAVDMPPQEEEREENKEEKESGSEEGSSQADNGYEIVDADDIDYDEEGAPEQSRDSENEEPKKTK